MLKAFFCPASHVYLYAILFYIKFILRANIYQIPHPVYF